MALGALAACAPATTSGGSTTTSSGTSQGASGSSTTAACDEFTASSFAGVINVPIGKPFVAGQDGSGGVICWYGIGENAAVTGSKVETLTDDNILITTIGGDGASQYKHFTGKDVNVSAVIPLSGIGDKASYTVSALTGNVPELYAVHGSLYCGIQLNAQTSELVSSDMAATAKNEGALCNDAFAKH
jgi:hypothetical protein